MTRSVGRFGVLDGLVELVESSWPLFDHPAPEVLRERLRTELRMPRPVEEPAVVVDATWTRDGLDGTELHWDAGFGPSVRGRLLRPAGQSGELPGALMFHCHGGVKSFGLEKLSDGADGELAHPLLRDVRDQLYGGLAPAEELARTGRAVLVHDGFGWGSRRLPVEAMPPRAAELDSDGLDEARGYDVHAAAAEDGVAKALGLLGTSWAGMLAREDLLALDVLHASGGVAPGGTAVLGFSGGGARAAVVAALAPEQIADLVVTAMVSTLPDLLPDHVHGHTWAWLSPGLATVGDWPEVVAVGAPRRLLVQYALQDGLFPTDGMRGAHRRIAERYREVGADDAYRGSFHDVPHSFDAAMQAEAWTWLHG